MREQNKCQYVELQFNVKLSLFEHFMHSETVINTE